MKLLIDSKILLWIVKRIILSLKPKLLLEQVETISHNLLDKFKELLEVMKLETNS